MRAPAAVPGASVGGSSGGSVYGAAAMADCARHRPSGRRPEYCDAEKRNEAREWKRQPRAAAPGASDAAAPASAWLPGHHHRSLRRQVGTGGDRRGWCDTVLTCVFRMGGCAAARARAMDAAVGAARRMAPPWRRGRRDPGCTRCPPCGRRGQAAGACGTCRKAFPISYVVRNENKLRTADGSAPPVQACRVTGPVAICDAGCCLCGGVHSGRPQVRQGSEWGGGAAERVRRGGG